MKRTPLLLTAVALAAAGLACNIPLPFNVPNLPIDLPIEPPIDLPLPGGEPLEIGPTETESILVPVPDGDGAEVEFNFGAGEFNLNPGASGALVEGEARYNVETLKPEVDIQGSRATISTGELDAFPGLDFNFGSDLENRWDLQLGNVPMEVEINAGAFEGDFELGGVPLLGLRVSTGAASLRVAFSEPNPVRMNRLRFDTGASEVRVTGLANANFERMSFSGGAGEVRLDFSGQLEADATVEIDAALASLRLLIPEDANVVLRVTGALADVRVVDGLIESSAGVYEQSGSGPLLTIEVQIGAGELRVERP